MKNRVKQLTDAVLSGKKISTLFESEEPQITMNPYVIPVNNDAQSNTEFRKILWTGAYLQLTTMSIPVGGSVGLELHEDTDQLLRVEQGDAKVLFGSTEELGEEGYLHVGDAFLVPAGTWHDVVNTGDIDLKLSSVYAPPHH